jgi:hypothetical protein
VIDKVYSAHGEKINVILVGTPEGKRPVADVGFSRITEMDLI